MEYADTAIHVSEKLELKHERWKALCSFPWERGAEPGARWLRDNYGRERALFTVRTCTGVNRISAVEQREFT